MSTRIGTRVAVSASALTLILFAGSCAATETEDASTSSPASPSAPTSDAAAPADPSAEPFAYPDPADPTQVAIYLKYEGSDPSGEMIAGPAVLVEGRSFSVEAQCEGGGASFEVVTAEVERRTLAAGDIECDDPPSGEFTYEVPYAGPVQVNLTNADDVGRAWVRVVQPR